MRDIVERLQEGFPGENSYIAFNRGLEAAAEIKRLRAELKLAQDIIHDLASAAPYQVGIPNGLADAASLAIYGERNVSAPVAQSGSEKTGHQSLAQAHWRYSR